MVIKKYRLNTKENKRERGGATIRSSRRTCSYGLLRSTRGGYIDNVNRCSPFRVVTEADNGGDDVKEDEGERGGT